MPTLTIEIPRPHRNQARIVAESARFNVVNCGRRWGKTVMGINRAILGRKGLLAGYPVGWFAPEYKLLKQAWRDIRRILDPITASKDEQDKRIELINGAALECWAFDRNPDSGRSRRYGTVVIDEAAHCEHLEESWTRAVRPTLTDFQGDAWFISSPNAGSYFATLYKRGVNGDAGWRSWTQTSYDNPHIPAAEIDLARDDIGDWAFEQEYLAVFHSESTDGLLKQFWVDRMSQVADEVQRLRASGYPGNRRVIAADLGEGTGRDRTVIGVLDKLGIIHCEASDRVGIPEAAVRIDQLRRSHGVRQEHIVFDAGGRGKDLPRYLEQCGITEAVPYHGSGKGGHRFTNKRSMMGWWLRQRLDPERPEKVKPIEYPPDYKPSVLDPPPKPVPPKIQPPFGLPNERPWWPSLNEELKALRYEMDGPKIKLENKEDLAKRLGRSPDIVDMLLMGMSLLGE